MGCAPLDWPCDRSVTETRPSATVCVLHQGGAGVEVLMVRRSESAKFMAGAWVFPGGVVDPEDHEPRNIALIENPPPDPEIGPWLAAAFREVVEETGLWLTEPLLVEQLDGRSVFDIARRQQRLFAGGRAAYFANWVTPTLVPVRFDARFFMVAVAARPVPQPDEVEIDAAVFVSPAEALRRSVSGDWLVPFPTQRTLHQLESFTSVDAAIDEWRNRTPERIQPRLAVCDDGALEVVMPGEPGFDELQDAEPDPDVLARAAQAAAGKGSPVVEVTGDKD